MRRAYQHIEALNHSMEGWGRSNPYCFLGYFNPDAGESVIQMGEVRRPPLLDWAAMIGDTLHNLRSALDHLICIMNRQRNPEEACAGTEFPILATESLWETYQKGGRLSPRCGLGKLGYVDDWTIAAVKRSQPFRAGEEAAEEEALWVLHELNRIDKHRTLHLGVTYFYEPEIVFDPPGLIKVVWVKPAGPVKHGDQIAQYRLVDGVPQGQVSFHVKCAGEILFDDGSGPTKGMKINALLDWLFDTVVWHIDVFDQHFFGGRPPAGSKRTVIRGNEPPVTTDIEGAHSNDPDAKRARWGDHSG